MRYYIDHEHRAYLPIFRGLVRPEFIAEGGLVVQIPVKNNEVSQQQLRAEILKLSQEQGNEYLRALVERKDIDWQQIVLTQKDWDYKQQGLTPAGAAILAIAITIATSGAGSAITNSVSGSLTNTLGASTANAVGAMSSAAFTSLVSQAGIALVNNQGDIKKTLKQLGQKDSIKQLATSVVTAGLLSKLGNAEWFKKLGSNTQTVLDDKILKSVIDSTARAVVETGINGGSLSENLEKALENSFINLAQGEMAHFIGSTLALDATEQLRADNLKQYLLHKLAHATAGCIAGSAKKDCEAGIIGAVVGEVMMEHLTPNTVHGVMALTDQDLDRMQGVSKLIAGTISAYMGYDAQIAIQSADTAIDNNNRQNINRFRIVNLNQQLRNELYAREVVEIRKLLGNRQFNGFQTARPSEMGYTAAEVAEIQAYRTFLQYARQTFPNHNVAYREFQKTSNYINGRFNDPIFWRNINFSNYNVNPIHQSVWDNIRSSLKNPHSRHTISGIKGSFSKGNNTLINTNLVDVARDIRNGLGIPISHSRIEINGIIYERHTDGKSINTLFPVYSRNQNEFFPMNRGVSHSLRMILENHGNYEQARKYAMNARDYNVRDFDEAVRIYFLVR